MTQGWPFPWGLWGCNVWDGITLRDDRFWWYAIHLSQNRPQQEQFREFQASSPRRWLVDRQTIWKPQPVSSYLRKQLVVHDTACETIGAANTVWCWCCLLALLLVGQLAMLQTGCLLCCIDHPTQMESDRWQTTPLQFGAGVERIKWVQTFCTGHIEFTWI